MIGMRLDDGVAIVTLEHGKANALDAEVCEALAVLFAELRGKAEIKAVVLTGQGKIFSAGVDLKRVGAGGAAYVREFLPLLHKLYDAAFFFPKPVVAAVNGHAIAGGAVLAACADRRIMARYSGNVGITELQVGVPLPALAFEIVRTVVPPRYLQEFALGAATYASDDALIKGWVDEVVDGWELMPRAVRLARTYASLSPEAFARTKIQIRQPASERLASSGAATDEAVTAIWTQDATLARIADYVAKTLNKTPNKA